jgi:hypothetical protein
VARHKNGESCKGFVDDTTLIAEGADFWEAFDKLGDMMTKRSTLR